MTTQAQIEAALAVTEANIKAMRETKTSPSFVQVLSNLEQCQTALAAAQVDYNDDDAPEAAAVRLACAQVADTKAAEIEAWSHQNDASRLAAEMLRKVAAAIRKDGVGVDPNIMYPGKDPDFVFPEE